MNVKAYEKFAHRGFVHSFAWMRREMMGTKNASFFHWRIQLHHGLSKWVSIANIGSTNTTSIISKWCQFNYLGSLHQKECGEIVHQNGDLWSCCWPNLSTTSQNWKPALREIWWWLLQMFVSTATATDAVDFSGQNPSKVVCSQPAIVKKNRETMLSTPWMQCYFDLFSTRACWKVEMQLTRNVRKKIRNLHPVRCQVSRQISACIAIFCLETLFDNCKTFFRHFCDSKTHFISRYRHVLQMI